MSDGGRESGKELNQIVQKQPRNEELNQIVQKQSRNEEFGRAIAKIAVAQICESEGFHSIQQSALESLADIAVRYVREVGKLANRRANSTGRSDCNVFDVIQGLEDLGMTQGFAGASDINRSLAQSGMIREISRFIGFIEEIPFVYPLPKFPVVKERKLPDSFEQIGEVIVDEHIPKWLPAFPDSKNYVSRKSCAEKDDSAGKDKFVEAAEQNKEERISQLQQRLTPDNRPGVVSCSDPGGDGLKVKKFPECNPFLAAPLQYGDKEVSHVVPPAKIVSEDAVNRVSAMEIFRPSMKPMKSGFREIDEGRRNVSLVGRPAVRLKLSNRRKSLPTSVAVNQPIDDEAEKVGSFFGDDEKDEKKRRAEQILKESMENHGELGQL